MKEKLMLGFNEEGMKYGGKLLVWLFLVIGGLFLFLLMMALLLL